MVADPGDGANRVLQLTGAKASARRAVPAIGTAETGTVFFRIRRPGNVDASLGLTDVNSPSAFTDFRVQVGAQNSATLGVRNSGSFPGVGTWNAGVWQCVWLVADHRARTVAAYSRGGPYLRTTRLPVDQQALYAFRASTNGALDTFVALTATGNSGTHADRRHRGRPDARQPAGRPLIRFRAIGRPILPSPMNPICAMD